MPWDAAAGDAAFVVQVCLARWVGYVVERRGLCPVRRDSSFVAGWLMHHLDWLVRQPEGPAAREQIVDAVRYALHVVDVKPRLWYAGRCNLPVADAAPCPCSCHLPGEGRCDMHVVDWVYDGDDVGCAQWHADHVDEECQGRLYVTLPQPDADGSREQALLDRTVRCPECEGEHDVGARWRVLLASADEVEAPAFQVATALTSLGRPVLADTIRKWRKRGKLEVRSIDVHGRPLYRIGDVRDLLAGEAARRPVAEEATG